MWSVHVLVEEYLSGELLIGIVPQFTLLASTKKGSKPDFHGAMGGEQAKQLYQHFFAQIQQGYVSERVKDGVFQAMMVYFDQCCCGFVKLANGFTGGRSGQ